MELGGGGRIICTPLMRWPDVIEQIQVSRCPIPHLLAIKTANGELHNKTRVH